MRKIDRFKTRLIIFRKILKAHHPEMCFSFEPPHGTANFPCPLKKTGGEPIGFDLLLNSARVAKLISRKKYLNKDLR